MAYELSADIGGTFTDLVLRTDGETIDIFKTSTTPKNIADGILNGVAMIAGHLGLAPGDFLARCEAFAIGTTIATNAILEGKQAKTGLVCTEGFRDTLMIREGGKPDSYDIYIDYPPPYIPRYLTLGVPERVNSEGGIETPLDEAAARTAIRQLREWQVESVAVSFLWSVVNPAHELRLGQLIEEEMPGIPYSLGHQVNPAIREYRRTSAVAVDASLKPLVQRRVAEIGSRLQEAGFGGVLTFITSSGGRTSPAEVIARPILLCLSGPSAAPQAGCRLSRSEGVPHGNVLTTDMGGTSFEVSVSVEWNTPMHREGMIGNHMLGIPSVEVKTIGAGGGSIARVDAGGFIHVGPESAGAMPGPACYGRGGTLPTVTDANLVRGLLLPEAFAAGTLTLDVAAAETAIRTHVADPLGLDIREAANLITMVAEQNMVAAIQDITIRRGVDPRRFVLVSGGAAGGLHAAAIARELGLEKVLIPRAAGVLSAYGIMTGEIKMAFTRSLLCDSAAFDHDGVNALLTRLSAEGTSFLDRMSVEPAKRSLQASVEARYAGQVWQISLPIRPGAIGPAELAAIVEDFHALHEKFYAVRSPGERVEFTEWTLEAIGAVSAERMRPAAVAGVDPAAALIGHRRAWLKDAGGEVEIAVYDGTKLRAGNVIKGPALVQEAVTVNLVPAGAEGVVTVHGGLMLNLPVEQANRIAA